jgi:hypothetical protein
MAKRILSTNADSKITTDAVVTLSANLSACTYWRTLIRENDLMQSECVTVNCQMLRGTFALFLVLLLMNGIISSAESDASRGSGIEGVVTVSPIRPGPVKKGSEVPNVAPLPNRPFPSRTRRARSLRLQQMLRVASDFLSAQATTLCRWRTRPSTTGAVATCNGPRWGLTVPATRSKSLS